MTIETIPESNFAPAAQPATQFELVSPFPREYYAELDGWFRQFPSQMLDDFWPKDLAAVSALLDSRGVTEQTFLVKQDGDPVGFIGYASISSHVGSLRGVCFDKKVHGNGVAARALRQVLQMQFDSGAHKILAFPFADNHRSIAFYYKLGAKYEGLLRQQTIRDGKLTDMLLLAFFAQHDAYPSPHGFPNFFRADD